MVHAIPGGDDCKPLKTHAGLDAVYGVLLSGFYQMTGQPGCE